MYTITRSPRSTPCAARAPAKRATRHRSGKVAAIDGQRAIHENVTHAGGEERRLAVRRPIGDGGGVEDDDISKVTDREGAALGDPQGGRGERARTANGLRQRQHVFREHVFAQKPGEGAVLPWVAS